MSNQEDALQHLTRVLAVPDRGEDQERPATSNSLEGPSFIDQNENMPVPPKVREFTHALQGRAEETINRLLSKAEEFQIIADELRSEAESLRKHTLVSLDSVESLAKNERYLSARVGALQLVRPHA